MQREAAAEDTGWRLEFANGPHTGAIVPLTPGRYRLGSDTSDDIVLADRQVTQSHAVLEVTAEQAGITPLAHGVTLRRRALRTGRPQMLKGGATVTIGSTQFRIIGKKSPGRRPYLGGFVVLLGIAGAILVYRGAAPASVGATEAGPRPIVERAPMTLTDAASAFQRYVAGTPFRNTVQISTEAGAVVATGTILPTDQPAWLTARKWFDGHIGSQFALTSSVTTAGALEPPALAIAAVSMEPVPNVVTRDGQHLVVGAVLPNGWSIDRITPQDVTLRGNGREIRIAL
jgi:hypothetical protein